MKPTPHITSSFPSAAKRIFLAVVLALPLGSAAPAAEPAVTGSEVVLVREEPMLLNSTVVRTGKLGEKFKVLKYDLPSKRVFVLSAGFDGKPVALNVPDEAVRLAPVDPKAVATSVSQLCKVGKYAEARAAVAAAILQDANQTALKDLDSAVQKVAAAQTRLAKAKAAVPPAQAKANNLVRNANIVRGAEGNAILEQAKQYAASVNKELEEATKQMEQVEANLKVSLMEAKRWTPPQVAIVIQPDDPSLRASTAPVKGSDEPQSAGPVRDSRLSTGADVDPQDQGAAAAKAPSAAPPEDLLKAYKHERLKKRDDPSVNDTADAVRFVLREQTLERSEWQKSGASGDYPISDVDAVSRFASTGVSPVLGRMRSMQEAADMEANPETRKKLSTGVARYVEQYYADMPRIASDETYKVLQESRKTALKPPDVNSYPSVKSGITYVGIDELFEAYRSDQRAADDRFNGKPVAVRGQFSQVVTLGAGLNTVILKSSARDQLSCYLVKDAPMPTLTKGERVTVVGILLGQSRFPTLREASLEEPRP